MNQSSWPSVGSDLNAHVGYMRHPEREALNLERERDHGGMWEGITVCMRTATESAFPSFCQDQHMVMVTTHYPGGGHTYWNAMRGREVQSRLDYILLPATRLQLFTLCFVLRREGRRLQLIPHRRPRDQWPLMIRAKLELLYGGVTMAPQDVVARDVDEIMPALCDPDRRISLIKEVEKWISAHHADTILEVAAQGQIEKAWTQIADALHQMARAQFQRTISTVPAEIKDAFVRRREALRHRQSCREALAATSSTGSLLALA